MIFFTTSQKMQSAAIPLASGTALFSLSACAIIPDPVLALEPKPAADYAATQSFAAPASDWPSDNRWKVYGDRQIDSLIDEALAASPDLVRAQALDVLTAEDALITNRRAVADLETRAFTLDVALIRALGGGYRA